MTIKILFKMRNLKKLLGNDLLHLALFLSLMRLDPEVYFGGGSNNINESPSGFQDDGEIWTRIRYENDFYGSDLSPRLHPKSMDSVLERFQEEILEDLNSLGRYNRIRSIHGNPVEISAYILNTERPSSSSSILIAANSGQDNDSGISDTERNSTTEGNYGSSPLRDDFETERAVDPHSLFQEEEAEDLQDFIPDVENQLFQIDDRLVEIDDQLITIDENLDEISDEFLHLDEQLAAHIELEDVVEEIKTELRDEDEIEIENDEDFLPFDDWQLDINRNVDELLLQENDGEKLNEAAGGAAPIEHSSKPNGIMSPFPQDQQGGDDLSLSVPAYSSTGSSVNSSPQTPDCRSRNNSDLSAENISTNSSSSAWPFDKNLKALVTHDVYKPPGVPALLPNHPTLASICSSTNGSMPDGSSVDGSTTSGMDNNNQNFTSTNSTQTNQTDPILNTIFRNASSDDFLGATGSWGNFLGGGNNSMNSPTDLCTNSSEYSGSGSSGSGGSAVDHGHHEYGSPYQNSSNTNMTLGETVSPDMVNPYEAARVAAAAAARAAAAAAAYSPSSSGHIFNNHTYAQNHGSSSDLVNSPPPPPPQAPSMPVKGQTSSNDIMATTQAIKQEIKAEFPTPQTKSATTDHHHHLNLLRQQEQQLNRQQRQQRARQNRDEKKAREIGIPFSITDITELPMDEFNDMLSRCDLTEDQLNLCRDIRRRGKNKVAAQNCRKRKIDQIDLLQRKVQLTRTRKEELMQQRHFLEQQKMEWSKNAAEIEAQLLTLMQKSPDQYTIQIDSRTMEVAIVKKC